MEQDNLNRKKKLLLAVGVLVVIGMVVAVIASRHTNNSQPEPTEISNHLNDSLPVQTSDYQISYDYSQATKQYFYTITLYAIINNPSQYQSYLAQLKKYKQEALDYISSKGTDPTKLHIEYEPPQAATL